MRPLAYALIVIVPLIALGTVLIAAVPSRPRPLARVDSAELTRRLAAFDGQPASKATDRERRQVRAELLRRGLGR